MTEEPAYMEQCILILKIPSMVSPAPPAQYLTPENLKYLLSMPDTSTPKGRRDLVLLTTLYKSIQEKQLSNLTNNAALENRRRFTMRLLLVSVARGNMFPTSPAGKQALVVISPVAAVYKAQAGLAVKGAERPAACGGLPLTGGPPVLPPAARRGIYPPEPPPFP